MVSGAPDNKRSRLAGKGSGGGVQGLRQGKPPGLVDGGSGRRGGGCKGFGSGGVGGRDTGQKVFLKDALWGGGGGYLPELAWWTGG